MVEQEDLKITSLQGHTKITTVYRATIDEMTWKLAEKIFHN